MEIKRSAGVLLHIASLPGSMGIGDLGKGAYKFIDWLKSANQSWWQILPFGPLTAENQPYSSQSSWAGAYEYIDILGLVDDGDLKKNDVKDFKFKESSRVDYEKLRPIKTALLEKAAKNFLSKKSGQRYKDYNKFCKTEKWWLDDWALFSALKTANNEKPWWEWNRKLALHDNRAISEFIKSNKELIDIQKYIQFVFCQQWNKLRQYAASAGIKIIGDLPIYCSRDSQDVWSARNRFAYDKNANLKGQAGVPPDCFSKTGQLWGMPVYNWEVHKKENYKWWMDRLRGSFDKADIVRLDHFMGFVRYYDIPAKDKDAKNGKWKAGPKDDFFKAVRKTFGDAPFIAEDLGRITDDIRDLRDRWNLPGMRVLQFAFGSRPTNTHLPHNYVKHCIVYTGTHDNDTALGWYKALDKKTKDYFLKYTSCKRGDDPVKVLINTAYSSIASLAVVPMQDILRLGTEARQNLPGGITKGGNYRWKLTSKDLTPSKAKEMAELVNTFGRA